MKICYINYIRPSIIHGGAERVVLEEAQMMADSGNEVVIISLKDKNDTPNVTYLYDGKIRNLFIPREARTPTSTFRKGISILFSLCNPLSTIYLKRLLEIERPDIVHIHQLGSISLCALAVIRETKLKVVQTYHGYYFECPLGSLTRKGCFVCNRQPILCRIYEKVYFRLSRYYDLIIAISPHVRDRLVNLGYNPRLIKLIPNSVTTLRTTTLSNGSKSAEILFVGRMTKAKGVHVLIKALKLVKGKYAAKLIGTGEDTAYFKSLANRLGVKAKFLGRVSDETLKEYYQRTRMVVVPSLFPELCSMVILEAMSYGKPIIASNIGGNPDLVINGQTGYLFEPGNEAKLAEHISELISNEKAALQMGSRGLRLSAKFSRQAHHKLLSEAYNEAMNSEKPC